MHFHTSLTRYCLGRDEVPPRLWSERIAESQSAEDDRKGCNASTAATHTMHSQDSTRGHAHNPAHKTTA